MGNTFQSMQSNCKLTDQLSLLCKRVTPIPHCTVRETTTNWTISLPGLMAEVGKPKPTCWISGLFPRRLLHSCCQPGCNGNAWTERGTGWVFQSLELWSRYLSSVKFYIPGWDLSFALSQAAEGGCPRDARRGTAISAVAANRSARTKAPRKLKAIWEAKVPVGKGSTVPEVNISAVLAALPEVQPSAAEAGACKGTEEERSVHSPHTQCPATPLPHPGLHTTTPSEHATLRARLQWLEILWEPPSVETPLFSQNSLKAPTNMSYNRMLPLSPWHFLGLCVVQYSTASHNLHSKVR